MNSGKKVLKGGLFLLFFSGHALDFIFPDGIKDFV
jgi:hypothetical protein